MDQIVELTVTERAVGRNVSLYPREWTMFRQIAEDHGLSSMSAAVRFVLHDWARMKAAEAAQLSGARDEFPQAE